MRILITGACGIIGRILSKSLSKDNTLALIDITSPEETEDDEFHYIATKHQFTKFDIADKNEIRNLIEYFAPDTVIHLAAILGRQTLWEQILSSNIIGTINVFEICLSEGVKKVIYASTNNVYGGYEEEASKSGTPLHLQTAPTLLDERVIPLPNSRYAVAKLMVEEYANYLSSHSELKTIGLRIGTVREIDNPESQENENEQIPRFRVTWLYHQDLIRLVRLCLAADNSGIYNAISGLPGKAGVFIDISKAIKELGYMPVAGGSNDRQVEQLG